VNLKTRAFGRGAGLLIGLAVLVFVPAWTLKYWQAWVFLAVFSLSMMGLTRYLMTSNPQLLERRLDSGPKSETRRSQKLIHFLVSKSLIAAAVLPAIDHRFGWSRVPPYVVALGDALVALGTFLVLLVFKENAFASANIEIQTEQKTITTGPYAVVRHPMYLGWLITFFGIPIALGSWWALFTVVPLTLVIVWRLLDEEIFLAKNLADYLAYQEQVRYRLVPYVW
jgi:protein-S-isoprenylcysteine O-methyltransferase Ste14